jgi:hypothetical protein
MVSFQDSRVCISVALFLKVVMLPAAGHKQNWHTHTHTHAHTHINTQTQTHLYIYIYIYIYMYIYIHTLLKHAVALAKPALERPSVVCRSLTMQN